MSAVRGPRRQALLAKGVPHIFKTNGRWVLVAHMSCPIMARAQARAFCRRLNAK